MPGNFFIDTSAFLALKDSNDQYHQEARAIAPYLLERTRKAGITTDYVLDETYTILRMRAGHKIAVQFGEEIKRGAGLQTVYLNRELFDKAWRLFKKYQDKELSFTDCTSFVVMRDRNINQAFTFDEHFQQLGFEVIKPKA